MTHAELIADGVNQMNNPILVNALAGSFGLEFRLSRYECGFVVEEYHNNHFYDHREFLDDEAAARQYCIDPFYAIRAENKLKERRAKTEEAKLSTYYARDYVKISTGRRIGRKPGAA